MHNNNNKSKQLNYVQNLNDKMVQIVQGNKKKHSIVGGCSSVAWRMRGNFPSVTNGLLKMHKVLYIAFSLLFFFSFYFVFFCWRHYHNCLWSNCWLYYISVHPRLQLWNLIVQLANVNEVRLYLRKLCRKLIFVTKCLDREDLIQLKLKSSSGFVASSTLFIWFSFSKVIDIFRLLIYNILWFRLSCSCFFTWYIYV